MLGAIIGDIVGSSYEVEEIKAIKTKEDKKRSYEERIQILKQEDLFDSNCSYTDDSILTIAIAESLLEKIPFEESLKTYGKKEISLGQDKYGRSRFGKGFISWVQGEKEGDSYGNGASMRISPVGYFYDDLDKVLEVAEQATIPSHNNEEAILGAKAVAGSIYLARTTESKEEILNFLINKIGYSLDYNLEDLQRNYHFSSRTSNSVPQALYCFLVSDSFEDCLRKSLSIGGDTDTIACIACSIAEAYFGIPEDLKEKALTYLPNNYQRIVKDFYSLMYLKTILQELNIYSVDFWNYITTHTKRLDAPLNSGVWGTFISNKEIKILVPSLRSELSYLINIHEYAHAYELFELLINNKSIDNIDKSKSEDFAKSKEQEYLQKKRTYTQL